MGEFFTEQHDTIFFGQQYIKVSFYSARSLTSLGAIFVRAFCFRANTVIQIEVEDLPAEAIQRTNSLVGPYLTCPRGIEGSESVRPFPSVVQEIACQNYMRTTFWGVLRKTSA